MKTARATAFALLCLGFGAAAAAEKEPALRVEVVGYGIYVANDKEVRAPNMLAGTVGSISGVRNVQMTDVIPAKQGVHFGIEFRPMGPPDGRLVPITFITQYPKPGLTNAEHRTAFRENLQSFGVVGRSDYYGFTFQYDWEMVCGHWQLEVWSEGKKLAEKDFDVRTPGCTVS